MNGKLLSQLPDFLCENELVERLKILPNYNINIANETMPTRLLALSELYDIYIPSQLSVDVYNKLYMALLRSIKKKENDMMVKQQRIENTTNTIQTYNGIIGGADSFTIIGVSGIGKSSAITRAISLIFGNHFIETTDPYQRIAPFILVQCPFDSSVKSLLLEIVRILDVTLDGDYLQIAQRYTTDRLIGFVIFSYITNQRKVEFVDVLNEIKNVLHIQDYIGHFQKKGIFGGFYEKIRQRNTIQSKIYDEKILDEFQFYPNIRFLKDHISLDAQQYFGIRYDVESQGIVIPIRNEYGQLIGVKERFNYEISDGALKYFYSYPGRCSTTLFGYAQNYQYLVENTVFVGEAEKFVMQCYSYGYRNAVALVEECMRMKYLIRFFNKEEFKMRNIF